MENMTDNVQLQVSKISIHNFAENSQNRIASINVFQKKNEIDHLFHENVMMCVFKISFKTQTQTQSQFYECFLLLKNSCTI